MSTCAPEGEWWATITFSRHPPRDEKAEALLLSELDETTPLDEQLAISRQASKAVAQQHSNVRECVRRLIAGLGPTLVAALAGAPDGASARAWASADGPYPDSDAAQRLWFADEQWRKLVAAEGEDVARAWFIGGNPWLGESTPLTAIREGRFREVQRAVQAMIDGAWSD